MKQLLTSRLSAFHFPENVNEENIKVNLDKGVLTVLIPKKEPEKKKKKKIEVK